MNGPSRLSPSRIACEQCSKAKTGCDKKEPLCSRCSEKKLECKFRYARRPPRANLHLRRQVANTRGLQHAPFSPLGHSGPSAAASPATSIFCPPGLVYMSSWGARQLPCHPADCTSYVCPPDGFLYQEYFDCSNENASFMDAPNSCWSFSPTSYESLLRDASGRFEDSHLACDPPDTGTAFLPASADPYWSGDGTASEYAPSDDAGATQNFHFADNGLMQEMGLEVQQS